ncbi:MAG: hypothetical protein KIH08_14530 [Candidatus Freyarchaeota archaeon]|nr:hypothetical protein [Candidatus Jordarchaeia archaeon]MBS7270501.1 hypothetical protein [Candidatus Jordarchaeia archaeon]MBS7281264.1 hypothetical protein [Candidatus Jordarchaeia archaeon]
MPSSKNEFFVEGEPDGQTITFVAKTAVEETAKLYGPIFTRMVSEYALQFLAEKLGESPPNDVRGLEAVTNYILGNLDRYPRGFNSLIYGIAKAENKLQGSTGAGARRAAYSAIKTILESSGLLSSIVGTTKDVFEAIYKAEEINKEIKTAVSGHYIRGGNNQVVVVVPNCSWRDACIALVDEGISRLVGGSECIFLIVTNAEAEIITKKHLDYKIDEFGKSECRGRIFEV